MNSHDPNKSLRAFSVSNVTNFSMRTLRGRTNDNFFQHAFKRPELEVKKFQRNEYPKQSTNYSSLLLLFGVCCVVCRVTTCGSIFIARCMYNYVDVEAKISKFSWVSSWTEQNWTLNRTVKNSIECRVVLCMKIVFFACIMKSVKRTNMRYKRVRKMEIKPCGVCWESFARCQLCRRKKTRRELSWVESEVISMQERTIIAQLIPLRSEDYRVACLELYDRFVWQCHTK